MTAHGYLIDGRRDVALQVKAIQRLFDPKGLGKETRIPFHRVDTGRNGEFNPHGSLQEILREIAELT